MIAFKLSQCINDCIHSSGKWTKTPCNDCVRNPFMLKTKTDFFETKVRILKQNKRVELSKGCKY